MKKILVVLLILAVVGGAFARPSKEPEAERGWGDWSGEAGLKTVINLVPSNPTIGGAEDPAPEPQVQGFFKLQWDYKRGDWIIVLPMTIDKYGVHTYDGLNDDDEWGDTLAKVEYAKGPLTVTIPFGVVLNGDFSFFGSNGTSPGDTAFWMGVGINAKYETDEFAFGFKVDDIFDYFAYGRNPDPDPWLSGWGAWGQYYFGGRATLAVTYKGEGTEWWRASSIVLGGDTGFWIDLDDGGLGNLYMGGGEGALLLGFDHHWENIASDFGGAEEAGIAFKFNVTPDINFGFAFAGTPMFDASGGDFVEDWLKHIVFGGIFKNDMFGFSAMVGLENDTSIDKLGVVFHAGLSLSIMEGLSIGADVKASILDKTNIIDFGVEIGYTAGGFNAGVKFVGADVTGETANEEMALGVNAGYTHALNDKFDIGINLGMLLLTKAEVFYAQISPFVEWKLITNGSIKLTYDIGFEVMTIEDITKNEIGLAFSWWF